MFTQLFFSRRKSSFPCIQCLHCYWLFFRYYLHVGELIHTTSISNSLFFYSFCEVKTIDLMCPLKYRSKLKVNFWTACHYLEYRSVALTLFAFKINQLTCKSRWQWQKWQYFQCEYKYTHKCLFEYGWAYVID